MTIESDLEEYHSKVLEKNKNEAERYNPIKQRVYLANFMSCSAGRNRRRRPRYISLLVVDNKYAHVVLDHEVKPRKKHDHHVAIDVLANEVLNFLPEDERTVDKLLEMVKSKKSN